MFPYMQDIPINWDAPINFGIGNCHWHICTPTPLILSSALPYSALLYASLLYSTFLFSTLLYFYLYSSLL